MFRDHLLRLDAAGRRDRFTGAVADEFSFVMSQSVSPSKSLVSAI